jgi:hypothetical protein
MGLIYDRSDALQKNHSNEVGGLVPAARECWAGPGHLSAHPAMQHTCHHTGANHLHGPYSSVRIGTSDLFTLISATPGGSKHTIFTIPLVGICKQQTSPIRALPRRVQQRRAPVAAGLAPQREPAPVLCALAIRLHGAFYTMLVSPH